MTGQNSTAAPAIDRAFLNFIENHKGGDAISELSAAMKQAAAATQLTGRASKVALLITLAPASKGTAETLILQTKVKPTLPEIEQPASIFYADADFNLVREDPRQKKLDLREPGSATTAAPLREVAK